MHEPRGSLELTVHGADIARKIQPESRKAV